MATNGLKSSSLTPETLPPKKRNLNENSNDGQAEPVFKMPSPFWNQNGFRRTRRTQEPGTVSTIDLHSAAMYYPLWTDMGPALQHSLWDNGTLPVWGQHFPTSNNPLCSNSIRNDQTRVHDFYGSPSYSSYLPAEPRDSVLFKSYERIPGQYGPKIIKPVPRSFASYYTREVLHKETFREEEIREPIERGRASVAQWDEKPPNEKSQNEWRTRKRNYLKNKIKQDPAKFPGSGISQHKPQSELRDLSRAIDISKEDFQHQQFAVTPPSFSSSEPLNPETEATTRNHLLARSGRPESQGQQKPASHPLSRFVEGSLIELDGGRLKRVEDLKLEDFECCTESCPELKLKRFTVQKITNTHTSGLISLEVELEEDLKSKICLEVCEEYPFFVCNRGWSSCSPARTSTYLRCHQLQLGDVCLALTPMPVPPTAPSGSGTCVGDGGHQVNGTKTEKWPKGTKMRRRHRSAP